MQEVSTERFLPAVVERLNAGTSLERLLAAAALANARTFGGEDYEHDDTAETVRLREEVRMLKERIHTLERITVDKESSLSRQIDDLRDR